MLSYQHGYHAGHFADVVKHLTLTRLLSYMTAKEKPLFYLETHSGRGIYDLHGSQASKTKEHCEGIDILWKQKDKLPPVFSPYLEIINQVNKSEKLRYYPGSPCIAINMLREQDRIYCCELHPREYEYLQKLPYLNKRVFYSQSDGIASLNALIPPTERRGLIFIDPSFEVKSEYKEIPKAIKAAYQRFSTGVYCLWYPLVDQFYHDQLLRAMAKIGTENALRIEFSWTNSNQIGMTGCGLWIINPPFTLAEEIKSALQYLRTLIPGDSSYLVEKV
jgi:23S rRNA (adenine2030-N6)-methyltransferase